MKYLSLFMTVCALLTMCILPAHAISPEEMEPFTVYDEEGNVIHSDAAAPEETSSLFLTKPFESYTVTEGAILLYHWAQRGPADQYAGADPVSAHGVYRYRAGGLHFPAHWCGGLGHRQLAEILIWSL